MDRDTVKRILTLEQRFDRLNLPEVGSQPVWLTEPYTHTDFDGDSFSDVGAHTKIENTGWSTTIPANAKALVIRVNARDSGSAAATSLYFALYSTATATNPTLACFVGGHTNDAIVEVQGIVPCTSGDVWYRVEASGATTLDVWLKVVGYWL